MHAGITSNNINCDWTMEHFVVIAVSVLCMLISIMFAKRLHTDTADSAVKLQQQLEPKS